jgi:hypothetical protein
MWFTADYGQAGEAMKFAFDKKNAKTIATLAKRQASVIKREFTLELMAEKLLSLIPDRPAVQIPTLNKIELPKLKKITNE